MLRVICPGLLGMVTLSGQVALAATASARVNVGLACQALTARVNPYRSTYSDDPLTYEMANAVLDRIEMADDPVMRGKKHVGTEIQEINAAIHNVESEIEQLDEAGPLWSNTWDDWRTRLTTTVEGDQVLMRIARDHRKTFDLDEVPHTVKATRSPSGITVEIDYEHRERTLKPTLLQLPANADASQIRQYLFTELREAQPEYLKLRKRNLEALLAQLKQLQAMHKRENFGYGGDHNLMHSQIITGARSRFEIPKGP